jgi:hypothetical protein
MSAAELREVARQQNDRDCAQHGIPRHIEDAGLLANVAQVLADVDQHDDGAPDRSGRRRLNRSEPIPARQPRDSRGS